MDYLHFKEADVYGLLILVAMGFTVRNPGLKKKTDPKVLSHYPQVLYFLIIPKFPTNKALCVIAHLHCQGFIFNS